MKNKQQIFDLFLISALGLFVELIFIRWIGSEVRIFGFYKNLALIAAFLGLGIGFATGDQAKTGRWFSHYYFIFMVVVVLIVLALGRTEVLSKFVLAISNPQEFIWAQHLYSENSALMPFLNVLFYATLFILFMLLTLLFIPLGNLTAVKFSFFPPLQGYTINILGSLSGILLYTFNSFLNLPPPIWFLLAGVAALYFLPRVQLKLLLLNGLLALTTVLITWLWPTGSERTVWSPYYRIDIDPLVSEENQDLNLGFELDVNQSFHQRLSNLDPAFVQVNYELAKDFFTKEQADYDTPYEAATNLKKVLIVGAGGGNDVAAGLRAEVDQIVAVDIDPRILELGEELHPEKPYAQVDRVSRIVQDARSYFRHTSGNYDLIVFGLLDSHTLFGAAGGIRLDNFVYTLESFSEVRELLAPEGLLSVSFAVPPEKEWVGYRISQTLSEAFGHEPQAYRLPSGNTLFLIQLEAVQSAILEDPDITYLVDYAKVTQIEPATDDWPYLYLKTRTIPSTYIIILLGIILLSFPLVRSSLSQFRNLNLHFFFMGTAFFLLETKSITDMALLFGSTWIVNATVIAAILSMIVVANFLVERRKLTNPTPFYVLLILSLIINYLLPTSSFLELALFWRVSLASFLQALPLFFAGMVFAISFSKTNTIGVALGSNLIGSVLGGVFEYTSLYSGIRSLNLFAIVFYLLSMLPLFLPSIRHSIKSPDS